MFLFIELRDNSNKRKETGIRMLVKLLWVNIGINKNCNPKYHLIVPTCYIETCRKK